MFVFVVEINTSQVGERITDSRDERSLPLSKSTSVRPAESKFGRIDPNRFARVASRAGRSIENQSVASIALRQTGVQFGWAQRSNREPQGHLGDLVGKVWTSFRFIVDEQLRGHLVRQ